MPEQPTDHAVARVVVRPVVGFGEVRAGDDVAALLAELVPDLQDGDVLVVTSKVVSKAEGRVLTLGSDDPDARERARQRAVTDEAVRVVAERGATRIVQTRQGLVLAAAGVDASNVARDELVLLPVDPDASAGRIREGLRERRGVDVAVVVSDSLGRPWRRGIVDTAIGVAGLSAVRDERGAVDSYGNVLGVTEVAWADEIAAAADLVKGKLAGVPVALVRGLADGGVLPDDGRGAKASTRPVEEDMFRLGTAEAIAVGRADAAGAASEPPPLHADAVALVTGLRPASVEQAALQQAYLGFLSARPDAMWRSCVPGHLTASALVVDPSRRAVLLTLHPRVGLWLQVGGHCEPDDPSVLAAAAREAREESGIDGLSLDPAPLGLDVHPITCSLGVPTRHFDVRFLAFAPPGTADTAPVISDESLDLRWFAVYDLPADVSADLPPLVASVAARLGL